MNKYTIAEVVFNNSDLGGKSAIIAGECIKSGIPYVDMEKDLVTAVIVHAVNQADDMDELESNFNYAIKQLEIAKYNALNVK